jgi:hopanoid biosynthesis associated protein HpnK
VESGGARLRSLIVTGDDFGFSHGVNLAIVRAHREGILTSASLMITGEASGEAVELARANPRLAVGLHLVLVCGRAALSPAAIPHLVDSEGRFPSRPVLTGLRYQFLPAARAQLRLEIRAQLERFRETGLPLSHVDGHLHQHVHPVVLSILIELADEFGIRAVRLPGERLGPALAFDRGGLAQKLVWSGLFAGLRRFGARRLTAAGIVFADRVHGLLLSGKVSEEYLLDLIPHISGQTTEIYCHPDLALASEPRNGPPGAGPRELAALLSPRVRQAAARHGLALTNYTYVTSPERARACL